ncbi:MAG: cyaK [Pseudobdellovibrio sp.]|jgi:adenylate cyclase|nr:cyaK [Pseudobdellovibrio sp.]
MFKKYNEILVIALLSALLTGLIVLFNLNLRSPEGDKSQLQISVENSSNRWNDLFYKSQNPRPPSGDVIVLAIDEPSLIEVGRWPWSRNTINNITKQLLSYNIKTLSYDIFFSERENVKSDDTFAKTVEQNADKLIFGTYSQTKLLKVKPYQDFCLTQAFLYTGGDSLVKINPFFAVIDETNKYEEIPFNKLFTPIFGAIDSESEKDFLAHHDAKNLSALTSYQLNTLNYYKKQSVYDYCVDWLTPDDKYKWEFNPALKKLYHSLFKTIDDDQLNKALDDFKKENIYIPIPQYVMWLQNIITIQNSAKYTASLVSHPDHDGVVRGYPLILRTGNQLGTSYIPSLALQAYLAATGFQSQFHIEILKGKKKVTSAEIFDVTSGDANVFMNNVPVDEEAKLLIDYYGKKNAITYVSAKELLNGSDKLEYFVRNDFESDQFALQKKTASKAEFLYGKNIILGATAVGIYDIRTTPNDINYPGPEIHATVLSNLLQKDFLQFDPDEKFFVPVLFFIFVFYNLVILIKTGARFGVFYFAFTFLAIIVYQYTKFESGIIYASSMLFAVLYSIAYFLTFIYKYFFQARRSNAIKAAFSKYVSKDVVEEILKNESAIELRGQKLHMSVFFSDIRGFTSFSENMDPVEVSQLLNLYFTPMSAIINAHQGTIDKYIGDAIMAMFGAPINYKEHAAQACSAALGCVEALNKINDDFAKRNWPLIRAGIGINSGYMNAGNIGSETIQNYTVIGDAVNLASRIQGLNKEYGTQILITEFTYELVKDQFECREIDKVEVRGRIEPIMIYELVSLKTRQ